MVTLENEVRILAEEGCTSKSSQRLLKPEAGANTTKNLLNQSVNLRNTTSGSRDHKKVLMQKIRNNLAR